MASGLLSLKWNNHRSTFFHVLSTIRSKESYCDVTLACDGRFYSLHKFVLSTCSEYFEEMFERTQCKHPVIVLKDIQNDDLEALLNYMYVGEVNVVQEKLAGLIKAAECLKIKGLAVPDEDPMDSKDSGSLGREQHKRSQKTEDSPRAKRRRRDNSSNATEEILSPVRSRFSGRNRDHQGSQAAKISASPREDNQSPVSKEDGQQNSQEDTQNSSNNLNRHSSSTKSNKLSSSHENKSEPLEVTLDDDDVKPEPIDPPDSNQPDENNEEEQDNKEALHQQLGFDSSDAMGGDNYDDMDSSLLDGQHQDMSQALPGSSGFQENSFPMWEGEGSLSNFPVDGLSGDNSQARQMTTGPDCHQRHDTTSRPHFFRQSSFYTSTKSMTSSTVHSSMWKNAITFPQSSSNVSNSQLTDTTEKINQFDDQEPPQFRVKLVTKYQNLSNTGNSKNLECNEYDGSASSSLPATQQQQAYTVRVYECSSCDYFSASKNHMQYHVRKHTGEQPYECLVCNHRFSVKSNLLRHCRTMHRDV